MMRRALPWLLAPALVLAAGRSHAQDPPPIGDPTPPSAAEGVRLAYRWARGRQMRVGVNFTGDVTVSTPTGQAGLPPAIPLTLRVTGTGVLRVAGVTPNGVATLVYRPSTARITVEVLGTEFGVRLSQGKVSASINGESTPLGRQFNTGLPGFDPEELKRSSTVRVDRQGRAVARPAANQRARRLAAAGTDDAAEWMVPLPAEPVQVGDRWEVTRVEDYPVDDETRPGRTVNAKMDYRGEFTLRELIERNGRKIAVIDGEETYVPNEASTALELPHMAARSTYYFDLARGMLQSVTTEFNISGTEIVPANRNTPGGRVSIDATIRGTYRLTPVSATPARAPRRR